MRATVRSIQVLRELGPRERQDRSKYGLQVVRLSSSDAGQLFIYLRSEIVSKFTAIEITNSY